MKNNSKSRKKKISTQKPITRRAGVLQSWRTWGRATRISVIVALLVALPVAIVLSQSQSGPPRQTQLTAADRPTPAILTAVAAQKSKDHLTQLNAQLQEDIKNGKNMQQQGCVWREGGMWDGNGASSSQWNVGGGYVWWYVEIDTLQPFCHDWSVWGYEFNGTSAYVSDIFSLWHNSSLGKRCGGGADAYSYSRTCPTGSYYTGQYGYGQGSAYVNYQPQNRNSPTIWTPVAFD